MNKVVIFRFGTDRGLIGDVRAITTITEGKLGNAAGIPIPGGLITLVETTFSPSECAEVFRQTAAELDDTLPVLCFDANTRNGFNFMGLDLIERAFEEFFKHGISGLKSADDDDADEDGDEPEQQQPHSVVTETCELSLDELLDLLNEVGSFESLTPAQQQRLYELTK